MKLTEAQVIAGLVRRGVPEHVARGVAMNFQDESGFDTGITGAGGDFGLAQWKGPRRAALEAFAAKRGVATDDPEMQLDFFMTENTGSEKDAWAKVLASPTTQDAAVNFVNLWERPEAQHAAARSNKYRNVTPETTYTTPSVLTGKKGEEVWSKPETRVRHSPNPQVGTGGFVAPGAPGAPAPAPVDALSAAADVATLQDRANPWSSLASGLAASVVAPPMLRGGDTGQLAPPNLETASALPEVAPPTGPAGGELGTLAELFKVGDFGQAVALNVDALGNPIRRRTYG